METIITLRGFPQNDPEDVASAGIIGNRTAEGEWKLTIDADRFEASFTSYFDQHIRTFTESKPPIHEIVTIGDDSYVICLDELVFRATDDMIECEYRLSTLNDLANGRTICSNRAHTELGINAALEFDDARIAHANQRTADALEHEFPWLDVISPESLTNLAEAADDLVDDDDE